jgi:Fur family ferric uptake transcriptional regulator
MKSSIELLKKHQLRNTDIRRLVLELFLKMPHTLSHAFLEEQLPNTFDRVTLYRTLRTFEKKGLIHRVMNDKDTLEYGLCKEDCQQHEHLHHDEHVHFRCENCTLTFCLETHVPKIEIPKGYQAHNVQMLVIGLCKDCQK